MSAPQSSIIDQIADERDELRDENIRLKNRIKLLGEYETRLSAVMPIDFKDWHQNSKAEWPEVAAWVISSQRERLNELEKWKDEALAVEAEWDPNALAAMLGAKVGQSQRKVIATEVPKLLKQVESLKWAGQELWKKASPFVFYYVINEEGEEVPIYTVEKSDEITADCPNTAGEIVSLIEALENWQNIYDHTKRHKHL